MKKGLICLFTILTVMLTVFAVSVSAEVLFEQDFENVENDNISNLNFSAVVGGATEAEIVTVDGSKVYKLPSNGATYVQMPTGKGELIFSFDAKNVGTARSRMRFYFGNGAKRIDWEPGYTEIADTSWYSYKVKITDTDRMLYYKKRDTNDAYTEIVIPDTKFTDDSGKLITFYVRAGAYYFDNFKVYDGVTLENVDFTAGTTPIVSASDIPSSGAISATATVFNVPLLTDSTINNLSASTENITPIFAAFDRNGMMLDCFIPSSAETMQAMGNTYTLTLHDVSAYSDKIDKLAFFVWDSVDGLKSLFDSKELDFTASTTTPTEFEPTGGIVGSYATTDSELANFDDTAWKISAVANIVRVSGALLERNTGVKNVTVFVSGENSDTAPAIMLAQTKTSTERVPNTDSDTVETFYLELPLNSDLFNGERRATLRIKADGVNTYKFTNISIFPNLGAIVGDFKNNINSYADIVTFFNNAEYCEILALPTPKPDIYSAEGLKVMYEIYENEKANYAALTEVSDVISALNTLTINANSAYSFIKDINAAVAEQRAGIIQELIEITYTDLAAFSPEYASMSTTIQNAVVFASVVDGYTNMYSRMFNQTYTDVQSVADALAQAYNDQYAATFGGGSGGGGGGGSTGSIGGGGGSVTKVEIVTGEKEDTNESEDKTDEEESKEDSTPYVDEELLPVAPFKDITDEYSWASKAITGLRQNSVVTGDGDGSFRPGSVMTREEYITLLFKTFGVKAKESDAEFSDVKTGEWYYDVVATAYEMGVTKGIGDGKFGIGQEINRSDMVVLASRLAAALNVDIAQTKAAKLFADYTEIPTYAYEAVVQFQQAGFISGDTNNKFNPVNNTTRAEAAVFFWSIFSALNK